MGLRWNSMGCIMTPYRSYAASYDEGLPKSAVPTNVATYAARFCQSTPQARISKRTTLPDQPPRRPPLKKKQGHPRDMAGCPDGLHFISLLPLDLLWLRSTRNMSSPPDREQLEEVLTAQ